MKHPVKFFAILFLVLAAVAAAILMTMRYMDVLQKQFDFLRGLLARRHSSSSRGGRALDDEYDDDDDDDDDELDDGFNESDFSDDEELKF